MLLHMFPPLVVWEPRWTAGRSHRPLQGIMLNYPYHRSNNLKKLTYAAGHCLRPDKLVSDKLRLTKVSRAKKNKVWGLTQEISVPSFQRIHWKMYRRSSNLKKLTYAAGHQTLDKSVSDKLRLTKVSGAKKLDYWKAKKLTLNYAPLDHVQTYGPFSQERASNGKDNLKKKFFCFWQKSGESPSFQWYIRFHGAATLENANFS